MQGFPHIYESAASADSSPVVTVSGRGLPDIATTPPPEFGGPEGSWSPETLLVASVADCFILTFKAISRASKLDWIGLTCDARGTLERVDATTRFTRFDLTAKLTLPADADREKAERLLQKSEDVCLITNSLSAERHLEIEIISG